jgi:hypothetical protein
MIAAQQQPTTFKSGMEDILVPWLSPAQGRL